MSQQVTFMGCSVWTCTRCNESIPNGRGFQVFMPNSRGRSIRCCDTCRSELCQSVRPRRVREDNRPVHMTNGEQTITVDPADVHDAQQDGFRVV